MSESARRLRLWTENPCCHWCGRRTKLITPRPRRRVPDDLATVDHVYSRLKMALRRANPGAVVLACYGCNQKRSLQDQREHQQLARAVKSDDSTMKGVVLYAAQSA